MKKDVPLCINFLTKKTPYKGLGADSEEKHEPVSDIDTAAADSLKVLDPNRPIREADVTLLNFDVRFAPVSGHSPTRSRCLLWAISGHRLVYSITSSAPMAAHFGVRGQVAAGTWGARQRREWVAVSTTDSTPYVAPRAGAGPAPSERDHQTIA